MPAEQYFLTNRPDQDFVNFVGRKRKEEPHKSPPIIIANGLVREAGKGLERYVDEANYGRTPTVDVQYNVSALKFGTILIAIERMITERTFNAQDMVDEMNAATNRRYKLELKGDVEPVDVSDEEWKKLMTGVSKDKTFSIFFEDPSLLPEQARTRLLADQNFPTMRDKILPKYKQLAELVVGR